MTAHSITWQNNCNIKLASCLKRKICLIKNKVLGGKLSVGFFFHFFFFSFLLGAILKECIYVFCISLMLVLIISTLHEKCEFKQYIKSELILVFPSLLSPVITFLKLNQIKKITKSKSQRFAILFVLLLLSSNKYKQAHFLHYCAPKKFF